MTSWLVKLLEIVVRYNNCITFIVVALVNVLCPLLNNQSPGSSLNSMIGQFVNKSFDHLC